MLVLRMLNEKGEMVVYGMWAWFGSSSERERADEAWCELSVVWRSRAQTDGCDLEEQLEEFEDEAAAEDEGEDD